jgi:hypothetical protein
VDDVQDLALGVQTDHPLLVLAVDHLLRSLDALEFMGGVRGGLDALRTEQFAIAVEADQFEGIRVLQADLVLVEEGVAFLDAGLGSGEECLFVSPIIM